MTCQRPTTLTMILSSSDPIAPPTPALLARQPLFDRDSATVEVLINAFTHLNMNDLVGNHQVYVNFTRNLIGHALPLNKSRLGIEALEDIVIDNNVVDLINALADEVYSIALDDFKIKTGDERLLSLADIVKRTMTCLTRCCSAVVQWRLWSGAAYGCRSRTGAVGRYLQALSIQL